MNGDSSQYHDLVGVFNLMKEILVVEAHECDVSQSHESDEISQFHGEEQQ